MDNYINKRKNVLNHPDYNNIIEWEQYKTEELNIKDTNFKINGNNNDKKIPVFQRIIENKINNENIIYEDTKIIILIPAINDNKNAPLNLISYCHFLIIPKIRIFNAVTLNKKHYKLLKYMKSTASNVMKSVLVSYNNPNKKYNILKKKYFKNNNSFNIKKNINTGLDLNLKSAKKIHKSIFFSVHLAPEHSIGYLHIHCYLKDLMLENEDLNKNFPLNIILNYFK